MIRRSLAGLLAAILTLSPAAAVTFGSDASPLDGAQNLINQTVIANGRGAITGPVLNQALNALFPVFNAMGSFDPVTGAFALNSTALGKINGNFVSSFEINTKSTPSCGTLDGAQATDGTQSYVISCYGVWSSGNPGEFSVAPTRGVTYGSNGAPTPNYMNTGFLVQSWADGNKVNNYNGITLNFQSLGGIVSGVPGAQDNAVGFFESGRMAPDASGHQPPSTWMWNWDFDRAPGAGSAGGYAVEGDLNDFDKSCGVGICNSIWNWFNGTSAYANLAKMYGGGAAVTSFSGMATTSGSTVAVTSFTAGTPSFTSDLAWLSIGGVKYNARYVDATHAQTVLPLPTNTTAVAFNGSIAQSHFGWFENGYEQNLEADARLADAAYWGIELFGAHRIGYDTTADTLIQAVNMNDSQTICWGPKCLFGGAGYLNYTVNGTNVFHVDGGGDLGVAGNISEASATLMFTTVALTNGAGSATGTLTNAPTSGNPTKWIPINDNGTTRYLPAW